MPRSKICCPTIEEQLLRLVPKWKPWVDVNSKPKNYKFAREKKPPTRFQKPGPMTKKDWKRFIIWAMDRAKPKKVFLPPPIPKKRVVKRPDPLPGVITWIDCLSIPRHPREKYEPPPKIDHPYAPQINPHRVPHRDPGRPFQPVKLPCCWVHDEVKMEFWRWMRFPISQNALKYQITEHILRLSVPRNPMPPPVKEEPKPFECYFNTCLRSPQVVEVKCSACDKNDFIFICRAPDKCKKKRKSEPKIYEQKEICEQKEIEN